MAFNYDRRENLHIWRNIKKKKNEIALKKITAKTKLEKKSLQRENQCVFELFFLWVMIVSE